MSPEASSRCDVCGGDFTSDQVIELHGKVVCAKCKPDVVMDIKSGVGAGDRVPPTDAERIGKKIRKLNRISFAFALPGIGLQLFGRGAIVGVSPEGPPSFFEAFEPVGIQILGAVLLIAGLATRRCGAGTRPSDSSDCSAAWGS